MFCWDRDGKLKREVFFLYPVKELIVRLESGGVACGGDSSRKITKVKSNEANLCFMKEASDTLKINNKESGLICNHYSYI